MRNYFLNLISFTTQILILKFLLLLLDISDFRMANLDEELVRKWLLKFVKETTLDEKDFLGSEPNDSVIDEKSYFDKLILIVTQKSL